MAALGLLSLLLTPLKSSFVSLYKFVPNLTPKEFKLLKYLYDNRNQVISREQLLNGVWNYDILGTSRMVDIHISHLRDKIEKDPHNPEWIKTARGFGYLFDTAHLDK